MQTRSIPSSREVLPVVGLGNWLGFDATPNDNRYARLPRVLKALFAAGGRLIDSSPMYARAERTVGELLATRCSGEAPFLATKVWTRGRASSIWQMEESFRLLRTGCIDLMESHNLVDWKKRLQTLREVKAAGRIRYFGITHYTSSTYRDVEPVLKITPVDFLQINYSLEEREAGQWLLGRLRTLPLPD